MSYVPTVNEKAKCVLVGCKKFVKGKNTKKDFK